MKLNRYSRIYKRWIVAIAFCCATFLAQTPAVHALQNSAYGEGPYSSCAEGLKCPDDGLPTVIRDASGVTFSVNLKDGQVIPLTGYTVAVTHISSNGDNFAKVEFYLDNHLLLTAMPDSSGVFYWHWNPKSNPGTVVKIIVYQADGTTTTQEFHVKLQTVEPAAEAPSSNPVVQIGRAIKKGVRAIPEPVAYAFPYLLFVLLGAAGLLLLLQTVREAGEVTQLARALKRDQAIAEEKDTFITLASHYLRTPTAIMRGAIEEGIARQLAPTAAWLALRPQTEKLSQRVEALLGRALPVALTPTVFETTSAPLRLWLQPGLVIPILLVGGLAFGSNVLFSSVKHLDVSFTNWLTQLVTFGLLAAAVIVLARGRVLRRRERKRTELLHKEQVELDEARNELIQSSAMLLGQAIDTIRRQAEGLDKGELTDVLRDGYNRFQQVLTKFNLAEQLKIGKADSIPEETSLTGMLQKVAAGLANSARAKRLSLTYPPDYLISCPDPDLLASVLGSVIDNAITHSPSGGQVAIGFETAAAGEQIITVTDQGPGISSEKLPLLFQPFTQTEGTLSLNHQGMGFSLYLDKVIMHYLGGDITLEPGPEGGTCAVISLPPHPGSPTIAAPHQEG